jgi:hypothetical protein
MWGIVSYVFLVADFKYDKESRLFKADIKKLKILNRHHYSNELTLGCAVVPEV